MRRSLAGLLAALVLVGAAGCGGGGDDDGTLTDTVGLTETVQTDDEAPAADAATPAPADGEG